MESVLLPVSKNIWEFDPRAIPGCILWIDAADTNAFTINGNNVVTSLVDKSALRNTMTTASVSPSSGFFWSATAFNSSYPAFFTTSAALSCNLGATTGLATNATPITVFFVAKYDGLALSGNVFLFDSPNRIAMNGPVTSNGVTSGMSFGTTAASTITQQFPTGTYPSGNFINCGLVNDSNSSIFTNGTAQLLNGGSSTIGSLPGPQTFGTGTTTIGSRFNSTQAWFGKISEVLFYNNALNTSERQQIEGYLALKWGLQSTLPITHPYSNPYSIVKPYLRSFRPTDVSSPCNLWFDGEDDTTLTLSGSTVTGWRDKSGNENNITSFSATAPTYNSTTRFLNFTNGTGTTTNTISLTSVRSYSIFYVITFFTELIDTGTAAFARPFQLSGTPNFFVGINRGLYRVAVSNASISGTNTIYNVSVTSGLTTGSTVTIDGITGGSYNGTGVVQSFITNTSITVNIISSGTPTSFVGATARNGTNNVGYYVEGNSGFGPFFFFAGGQGFNTYAGRTFIVSFSQTGPTSYVISVNGNTFVTNNSTETMSNNRRVIIGNNPTSGSSYGLGELLYYNGELSNQDRQRVEAYLTWKWKIQRTTNPGASTNFPITHPFYRFPSSTTTPFTPISLSNLFMWYDGAETSSLVLSGSTINVWNDKSGNGNNLSVAVGPTRTATTSNPTGWDISFNGTTQYIRSNSLAVTNGTNRMTVFMVVNNNTSAILGRIIAGIINGPETTEAGAFRFSNAGSNSIAITKGSTTSTQDGQTYTIPSNIYNIISVTWDGLENSPVHVNGSLNGTYSLNSNTTFSFSRFGFGASLGTSPNFTPATFWAGSLNEVLLYRSALTFIQRQQVEGYLAWKWGLQASLPTTHLYYKFPI